MIEKNNNIDALLRHHLENIDQEIAKFEKVASKEEQLKELLDNFDELDDLFYEALKVKKIYGRINDLIHAYGMLKYLRQDFRKDESKPLGILSLSLGPNSSTARHDLVSKKKVAEFKFSDWNENGKNGIRGKQVAKDFVRLILNYKETPTENQRKYYLFLHRKKDVKLAVDYLKGDSNLEKILTKKLFHFLSLKINPMPDTIGELYQKYENKIIVTAIKTD